MSNSDIGSKIIIRNKNTLEEVSLEQEYTKLRAGSEIMAFHYKAPLYLTIDLERYFELLYKTGIQYWRYRLGQR